MRSHGMIDASFRATGRGTALHRSYQAGNLRLRLPRPERAGEMPCAVVINTAGGVAGGDSLDQSFAWEPGAAAIVTSQAAEKVYRALGQAARIATRIEVGAGATAEWLPQETILFDGCALTREARVLLADGASFLGVEALVLGRRASGEVVRAASLRDRLRIWRGGRLVYADALVLGEDVERLMQRAGVGSGAGAMAVLVHASDRAAELIAPVREAIQGARGRAAASAWNGLLAVRLLASDGETLRHDVALALAPLRGGRPLPRVWRC
jgi:urease accessory protein